MKETFKRYLPYMKEYKFQYFLIFIGIMMIVASTAATAQIMQPLMDDMFVKRDERMLYIIPISLIVIYIVKAGGTYLQGVFMKYVGLHIVTRIRSELLEKIISLDMQFLFTNRSGELISRLTSDLGRVQYFVSRMLPDLIREGLTVVSLIAYVIWLNPMLTFYSLVLMPLTIYPLILIAKRLKKLSHRSQEKNADVTIRLTEVFNNNEIIKANATESYEIERFSEQNWKFFKINMKSVYTNALISPLMEILGATGLAAVIYIGAREVYAETMSVGEFTAFLTAIGLVFQPLRRVSSIYGRIQDAIAATERVYHIFDLESKIKDGPEILEDDINSIEFKNTGLQYDSLYALRNINLKVHSSQNIALVGDSGGGKSSLLNMILRFYDANEGSLLINGKNINSYTQNSLRSHISMVSQRVYIFQDTLAANVAYGAEIDEDKVNEALKLADASEFVNSLADGIYTVMDEAGTNLSGGQRQRIAIARAIYKKASVLMFDEATSALDNKSEKRIQEALDEYSKDKITLTIAHRLSTVRHADKILVFKKGEIVASGTHDELLKNSNEYQRLSGVLS